MVIASNEWMNNYEDDRKSQQPMIDTNIRMMAPPPLSNHQLSSSNLVTETVTTTTSLIAPTDCGVTPEALSSSLTVIMASLSTAPTTTTATLQTTLTSSVTGNLLSGSENLATPPTSITTVLQTTNPTTHQLSTSISSINSDDTDTMMCDSLARIILLCEPNSHPFQTRTILLSPNIECKVGRLIAKSKASETNAIFDCKVLSRNHAVLWFGNDGKFYVKDTKSSNGTFINETKLSSEAAELHFGDVVKFGVDVLENSRKEVHGCIIACVKLYLPDGREAISIDSHSNRSQYTGEGRISFDELHRLNLYMQETSQREKLLKAKLFNIQNILDVTRKNSASCWQSMIAEDQLLHRIHLLENKLQFMEKNAPENMLRDEMFKLLDDKCLYQHSAKEALRKVYQERCDAMQMLSKMESAFSTSDNECKILRDQILTTKQNLQDVNSRLLLLQTDYNEYREETDKAQQEAKERELSHTSELADKLREREIECEEYKKKIGELLLKRAELLDEQQKAQQMLEQKVLDEEDHNEQAFEDEKNNDDDEVREEEKIESPTNDKNKTKQQVATKSTILKWLENSDLNEKEGSLDIFKAICNESDSSDESGGGSGGLADNNDFELKCANFQSKLQSVQKHLTQLEGDMAIDKTTHEQLQQQKLNIKQISQKLDTVAEEDDGDDDSNVNKEVENEKIFNTNGATDDDGNEPLPEDSAICKNYLLLKSSVSMLREAFNELTDHMASIKNQRHSQAPPQSVVVSVQTQLQNQPPHNSSVCVHQLKTQETIIPTIQEQQNENNGEEIDDIAKITEATTTTANLPLTTITEDEFQLQTDVIVEYQLQIEMLQHKLIEKENNSMGTVEHMQIERDALRDKISELTMLIDALRDEKQALEQVIAENKLNAMRSAASETKMLELSASEGISTSDDATSTKEIIGKIEPVQSSALSDWSSSSLSSSSSPSSSSPSPTLLFEKQMKEELAAINNTAVQREEELILYKEQLERTQNENHQLKNEISELKIKADNFLNSILKKLLTYGAVFVALILYFILSYF